MPKERIYRDIHLRLSEKDLHAIEVLAAQKKTTRTAVIRQAIASYVFVSERERSEQYETLLVKQIKELQAQLSGWLGMLWRASAESMFVCFEAYKRNSAQELTEADLNALKADGKKFARKWVTKAQETNLTDRLELSGAEPYQMEITDWKIPGD